jgi:6-phosphogluconolactonase
MPNTETLVYVGTYTRGKGEGIHIYRLDPTGALEPAGKATGGANPSFLAFHPSQHYLYAVNSLKEFAGEPGGAVSAFSIDPRSGALTVLNQQPSQGIEPCYLSVDATGRYVLLVNYTSGSVCVLPIEHDGRLGAPTDHVQHHGASVDPRRQEAAHAHSVVLDPANRYALVADLGLDKIMVYQLNLAHGKLIPNEEPWASVRAGSGPRHIAFHPNGRYVYVINELGNTVTAFAYDGGQGALREIETVSALPEGFQGVNYSADVHISPSGRFLYGSNRGHDSIVIMAIDEHSGKLTCVGHEPTQGRTPRNFALDPTGTLLLAANQDSGNVVTFRIDQETGKLSPTGHVAQVPMPVCVKVLRLS